MNLDHLEENFEKDVSLNRKKTRRSKKNFSKKPHTKKYSGKKKNEFSNKQRRIINSGNVRNLNSLKERFPHRFKCSICVHSDSGDNPKFCILFKDQIVHDEEDALNCDYIEV